MPVNIPGAFEKDPNRIVQAIRDLASGKSNAHGKFTIATAGTLTVKAPGCGADTHVSITPRDSSAEAAHAYVSAVRRGEFDVTSTGTGGFSYGLQG